MEPTLERTFVRFSIDRLKLLASRIEDCLGRLTEEQVWARSNENQNAIGNLVPQSADNGKEPLKSRPNAPRATARQPRTTSLPQL